MKTLAFLSLFAFTFACGDSSDPGPEPETGNLGFTVPTETTQAYIEQAGQWVLQGDADWSCLNQPRTDTPSNAAITLSGEVLDFQDRDVRVGNATVTAFDNVAFTTSNASATADEDGAYSITLEPGRQRVGFKVSAPNTRDTYLIDKYFDPDMAQQPLELNSVAESTVQALTSFVNERWLDGDGVVAGNVYDCQGNHVSNAIATSSSQSMTTDHLASGDDVFAQTFYFSDAGGTSLPVKQNIQTSTAADGLFMVLHIPAPTTTAYMQVWGFTADQDPATDDLTLLSEVTTPVIADAVITSRSEPYQPLN